MFGIVLTRLCVLDWLIGFILNRLTHHRAKTKILLIWCCRLANFSTNLAPIIDSPQPIGNSSLPSTCVSVSVRSKPNQIDLVSNCDLLAPFLVSKSENWFQHLFQLRSLERLCICRQLKNFFFWVVIFQLTHSLTCFVGLRSSTHFSTILIMVCLLCSFHPCSAYFRPLCVCWMFFLPNTLFSINVWTRLKDLEWTWSKLLIE